MNKIVRGEIKSIGASVGKIERNFSYEASIDTLEYIITLDDDNKYRTRCSIEDFKIGDLIDIAVFEDDKKGCIILNKETSQNILNVPKFDNFVNSIMPCSLFLSAIPLGIDIIKAPSYHFFPLLLVFTLIAISIFLIVGIFKKNKTALFSDEEYILVKKYRDGYSIKDEQYINLNKPIYKEVL